VSRGATHRALYFAYGSNLSVVRLQARVASARVHCRAWLDGHRVSFGKLGRDGSGKATLVEAAGERAWGAVYTIDPSHWAELDRFEPGYQRIVITLTTESNGPLVATTYRAPETAPDPTAFASYKQTVIAGAIEHALPGAYIDWLRRLPERPDPFTSDAPPACEPPR